MDQKSCDNLLSIIQQQGCTELLCTCKWIQTLGLMLLSPEKRGKNGTEGDKGKGDWRKEEERSGGGRRRGVNPFLNDKILDQSESNKFADNKINVTIEICFGNGRKWQKTYWENVFKSLLPQGL